MFEKNEFVVKETLLERMKNSKDDYSIVYKYIFNDGTTSTDKKYESKRIENAKRSDAFDLIGATLCAINDSYARYYSFDTLNINLKLGLVFYDKNIEKHEKIELEAEPIKDIVHYYTTEAYCYLNGEKVTERELGSMHSRQGYIKYDTLIRSVEKNGLIFNGPKTFEEFKEQILTGEPFDISLTACFLEKEESKELQYTKKR